MKILSFRVQPGTAAAMYATGDKVYFQGDKWTEKREEAAQFAHVGALLRAVSEFAVQKGEPMPDELSENFTIEEYDADGTGNHVTLTDDEVRLLEFITANTGIEHTGLAASPISTLHRKLKDFGLSRGRASYHLTLGDVSYHLEAESNGVGDDSVTVGLVKDTV